MRIALVLLLLLTGCAHTAVSATSGAPATGTTVTGGSVSVHAHGHSLAALVVAGILMASFADGFRGAPPPEMAAERKVLEHDCTQPLPEDGGNLKCR